MIFRFKTSYVALFVAISIWFFWLLIPTFYLLATKIPDFNKLNKANGILTYVEVKNRGVTSDITVLKTDNGDMTFSCKDALTNDNSCYTFEYNRRHENISATIYWYKRIIYPFISVNYPVQIESNKQILLSYERSVKNHGFQKVIYPIGCFIALITIIALFFWNKSRYENILN